MDSRGVARDLANYERLKVVTVPTTEAELCTYIHGVAWMSVAVLRSAERASPLILT